MADNKSPWDDSNDSPWQGEANTEKVVKFRRIKKSGGFSFDGGAKLIIGAAAAPVRARGKIRAKCRRVWRASRALYRRTPANS